VERVIGHAGRAAVATGEYALVGWSARRRDPHGRLWEVSRAEGEPARVLSVRAGRMTPLPLAAPVQAELVVEQTGSELAFRVRLMGAAKETLDEVRVDGRPLPPPGLRIQDARGHIVARLADEGRCGAGCAMVWRPPPELLQPLRATPEAALGPFRPVPATFRFRINSRPSPPIPAVGQVAPDFTLSPPEGGVPTRLSSLRGQPVLLCFFCGCGDCQAAAKRLTPEATMLGARIVAIVENERQLQPDQIARFRQVTGLTAPLLADHGGAVTRRYHSVSCPRVWALDRAGVIRYHSPDARATPAELVRNVRLAVGRAGVARP
jgi:peroxiredoxin